MKVTIDTDNIFDLDLVTQIVYAYIKQYIRNNKSQYKIFDNERYYFLPVVLMEKHLRLTPFIQRNALDKLTERELIVIRFGQGRSRYIRLLIPKILTKQDRLINAIKALKQSELDKVYNLVGIE